MGWPRRLLLHWIVLMLSAAPLCANQLPFERLSEKEGLFKNTITCGLQDRAGFLWFGTEDGLLRYDGYTFKVYINDPADPHSLSSNLVYSLLEDRQGFLWVGTVGGGLNRFDPRTGRFLRYQHDPATASSLSHNAVIALLEDRRGNLWIGTEGGGLNRLGPDRKRFTHYRHHQGNPNGISFDSMWHLFEDRQGKIWIGTHGGGLDVFDPATETFTHFRHREDDPHSLASNTVGAIHEDRHGIMWIGGLKGLNRLDPATGEIRRYQHDPSDPASIGHSHVWDIYEDDQGILWIGSFGGGINRFDPVSGTFRAIRHRPAIARSLSSDLVWFLLESRDGVLWVGTDGGGLNKWVKRTEAFNWITADPGNPGSLLYNGINDAAVDRRGVLWLANDGGGIQRFDPQTGTGKSYRSDPSDANSLKSDLTECILVDHGGTLWIGTYNGGLNALDPGTGRFAHFLHNPADAASISDNRIWALFEDSRGYLWVGTRHGLNRLDPASRQFKRFYHRPESTDTISDNGIWAIAEDHRGDLWIGTDHGLNHMKADGRVIRRYYAQPRNPDSLSHNTVTAIFPDGKGTLWIGSNGGLDRMDLLSGHLSRYALAGNQNGSNSIRGITKDQHGHLWITTLGGLCRLDPENDVLHIYGTKDGLQGNEFSRALIRTDKGRIVAGGRNGINVFLPARIMDNDHVPPMVLTRMTKHNTDVPVGRELPPRHVIPLSYKDNAISFEFAALDFCDPARNRYAYKLDGFDKEWIQSGTRRTATYTNLDGGHYIFRVRGSNNHGVWSPASFHLTLDVQAPPWKRWWAYLLYILAIVAIIAALAEYRLFHQRKRMAAVEQLNRELQAENAERQRAENALRVSEERLNLALDGAGEGIWDYYPQSGDVYFSPTWFTLLGYGADEYPHTYDTWTGLLHPDDRPEVKARMQQFIDRQGDEFSVEYRMRAKTGGWRWIMSAGKTLEKDPRGGIVRMSGIHLDITDRKHWETSLAASERRFRALFNEAPMMYVVTENREGVPHIKDVNNLFLERLGHRRENVLGAPLGDYYVEGSKKELLDSGGYDRALRGEFLAAERDLVSADNETIHTLLHALPAEDDDGCVIGTLAMFLDITARKKAEKETRRLEAALNQAQKMEAIGTLAGGIAHDFNNLLSGVIGFAELALTDTPAETRQHENLNQILTAGMRARDLVKQILAFSRQDERELKPVNMAPLVKEALKLLRSTLPATIEIQQAIAADTDTVMADATQIHQIVMNLCTNAAHAMEGTGGILTVDLTQVVLTDQAIRLHPDLNPGTYIQLSIQDTGQGIPPDLMDKIFEPYFTTKEKDKGTGLGLSVVHGIVKGYGGDVSAYSEPGKGTRFNVYIPTVKHPQQDAAVPRSDLPGGSEHILLVDDEPLLIQMGRQSLEHLGYRVTACVDGLEALACFRQSPDAFDLVLTDMTMPKMTGEQLLMAIRRVRPDVPAIISTGFDLQLTRKNPQAAGAQAVLLKPIQLLDLALTVRQVLDNPRQGLPKEQSSPDQP